MRGLKEELRDDYITFDTLRGHRSASGEYTTALLESIRALASIGSEARDALPQLEKLANQALVARTNPSRLQRTSDVPGEAQRAIDAIRSVKTGK